MANPDKNQTDSPRSGDGAKEPKDVPVKSKDDMQQRLGLGLKNMYLSVLEEPLPDDMLALLDQLEDNDDEDADTSRPDVNE
mgnify:CR=1 FL=1